MITFRPITLHPGGTRKVVWFFCLRKAFLEACSVLPPAPLGLQTSIWRILTKTSGATSTGEGHLAVRHPRSSSSTRAARYVTRPDPGILPSCPPKPRAQVSILRLNDDAMRPLRSCRSFRISTAHCCRDAPQAGIPVDCHARDLGGFSGFLVRPALTKNRLMR